MKRIKRIPLNPLVPDAPSGTQKVTDEDISYEPYGRDQQEGGPCLLFAVY
jgi:hypothetical protein